MTDRDPNSGKFLPGNKANPGGRPKDAISITALIDEAITVDDWKFIIGALLRKARRGDLKATEMLLDRRFGKPVQSTELTGKDGAPVEIKMIEVALPPEDE